MLQNNSSKSYPQIILPKNHGSSQPYLKVRVRGQIIQLTAKDFFELTPIISLQNVPDIKNSGLDQIFYNQSSLKMFNIFLYYCIKIDSDIQVEGLDTHYLKELCMLYVDSGLNIDISKYARQCNLCIKMEVRKCAHIIYYLIYGRLATNSYICFLISQISFKKQNKRYKLKKIISSKNIYKKEVDNRSFFNLSAEQQEISIADQLVSDLKQIFHGPIKQKQSTTNTRKYIYQKSGTLQSQTQIMIDQLKDKNLQSQQQANEYFNNYFPKRVLNQQKSAIFQTIYPSFRPNYKFMRKKNFDDTKIQKILDFTYHQQTKIKKTDLNQILKPFVNEQKSKNYTQNVLKTSQKLKNRTKQLDRIRSTIKKQKTNTQTQTCQFPNSKKYQDENQRLYLQLVQKSNRIQKTHKIQVTDLTKTDYQNENKFINLLRKQQKHKKYPDYDSQQKTQNEKRIFKKLSNNQKQNQKRIFHSQCQNRLFKYKNQYRRFMKIHFFNIDSK